jgi:predicted ATPase
MTGLVSRHYEILDDGIAVRGGKRPQEQGEGDSVVAVFVDPRDALAAAVETQLALRRQLPDLPVRMALHTGEAMLRNEANYVGLTIIRCARIRACGHGGQILLSDDCVQAIGAPLPDGLAVHDLGSYGLRGLDGRERIWQLDHPDLPHAFAPLKAGTSAAGNLPAPISSFVGRRSELTTTSRALTENRLVTLTGDAGIGKSRLAIAAADAAANSLPGGVWWVALSDVSDDEIDAVSAAVMRACSLTRSDADPVDTIADHFRSVAESVLIVDGYDQVRVAAAALVDRLLARCPDTVVLGTGREPLNIPGEAVHRLGPLSFPAAGFAGRLIDLETFDAARLFVERATNTAFRDDDAVSIATVCLELGGVPLAIELAAARSGSTSIRELAASLGELAARGSASESLTVTLASSIGWTYQLLGREPQTALRRLSVFRREFEIDAATVVAAGAGLDEAATATAIRRLLEQNLLTFDGERISMSPAIRAFAHDRLVDSTDLAGATSRHGDWFAAVAERYGDGSAIPVSLLAPDEADVVAALETSMRSGDPAVAYRILVAVGTMLRPMGHADLADRAARWVCGRSPGDGEEQWAATVARLCFDQASNPEAPIRAFADEARAIAELVGDEVSPGYLDRCDDRNVGVTAGTVEGDMAISS